MVEPRVLFVALATHGHFNPGLHLANLLCNGGLHVTFTTSASVLRRVPNLPSNPRLSFAFFSDGHDDGFTPGNDVAPFLSEFEHEASKAIREIILESKAEGKVFSFVVYSLLTPWMSHVARSFKLPSALFWNQSASVFAVYYHFFNGYRDLIQSSFSHPSLDVHLPGLPLLNSNQLPSLCDPADSNSFVLKLFESHFQVLRDEPHLTILINSFDELEHNTLRAIVRGDDDDNNVDLIPIGPVLPASPDFLEDSTYDRWLNSKPESSVVYVSFGSIATVSKAQLKEIARGLLDSGRPFLWVMRKLADGNEGDALRSCRDELEARGKIVTWCSQLEVLSNPATGCFLTHCGWNSTLESLVCGVPVVAFPQWTDQGTNAKIVEDLSMTGVRLRVNNNGNRIVEGEEIKRCLEVVMGGGAEGEVLRRNAMKWKELAKKAATNGGSSNLNIRTFIEKLSNQNDI